MFNSVELNGVAQYGFAGDSTLKLRRDAAVLFSRAMSRSTARRLGRLLTGRRSSLRSLADLSGNPRRRQAPRGVVNVPLDKIVGSEGRNQDFDDAFNPRRDFLRDRWIGIAVARRRGVNLPPVDLIQVGDEYYVQDGNHRVSVAKAAGQAQIEARIVYALETD